ncbi:MAG: 3-deoxy-manno-octulosonate cytidylyltransferase [Longimicrobiales bacterium]
MRTGRVLGVIPARLGSERLPRKPLHPLAGRPLIEWVWRRVESFQLFDALIIATDSEEIAATVRAFGGRAELTAASHASGTERVAEIAGRADLGNFAVIVNVQGDEPFLEREQVAAALDLVHAGWPIGTAGTPLCTIDAWRSPAVVKVIRRADGGALYFSRAPIPWPRDGEPSAAQLASDTWLRHLGVYAYTADALRAWMRLPPHPLEQLERLEQLRPLAAGIGIGVAVVASSAEGVDTPEDAERAERVIRATAAIT